MMQELLHKKFSFWLLPIGILLFFTSMFLFVFQNTILYLALPVLFLAIVFLVYFPKSFYFLFILSVPLSALIYIGDSLSTTAPDEPIMWLFFGLSLVILFFKPQVFPIKYLKNPIFLILFLQVFWMVISVVFSQNPLLSVKYALAKLWMLNAFVLFAFLMIQEKKDFKLLFLLLVIPISILAVQSFLKHAALGFGLWESNIVVQPFYYNHVDYSTVLSMIFPVLLIGFQLSKGKIVQQILIGGLILFYIPAIFAASARAAILAVVFALFISLMIRVKKVRLVMPSIFFVVLIGAFFLAKDYQFIYLRPSHQTATQKTFSETVVGMFTGKDMSSMERFYRWVASVRMAKEHPLVGVGPNNFYDYYKPHAIPAFRTWVSRNPERSTTHNYFLYMLTEQGIPAMVLYGVLLMVLFRRAELIYHRTKDRFFKLAAMSLAMLMAASFINNFFSELLETHKVGGLFYLSIALLIIIDYKTSKTAKENQLEENKE